MLCFLSTSGVCGLLTILAEEDSKAAVIKTHKMDAMDAVQYDAYIEQMRQTEYPMLKGNCSQSSSRVLV